MSTFITFLLCAAKSRSPGKLTTNTKTANRILGSGECLTHLLPHTETESKTLACISPWKAYSTILTDWIV